MSLLCLGTKVPKWTVVHGCVMFACVMNFVLTCLRARTGRPRLAVRGRTCPTRHDSMSRGPAARVVCICACVRVCYSLSGMPACREAHMRGHIAMRSGHVQHACVMLSC